jgi:hypothetical protein
MKSIIKRGWPLLVTALLLSGCLTTAKKAELPSVTPGNTAKAPNDEAPVSTNSLGDSSSLTVNEITNPPIVYQGDTNE